MYFTLKRNFMHCMHHLLVLFAFDCSKGWNIIFQFKIYLTKLYIWDYIILPNKIFCCLQSLSNALFDLFDIACLILIHGCLLKLFYQWLFNYNSKPQKYLFKNTILKSYIKVSNKPLCILYFILSQKLFHYFKSGILNKPHIFI